MTMDKNIGLFWMDYLLYVSFICGLWLLGCLRGVFLAYALLVPNMTLFAFSMLLSLIFVISVSFMTLFSSDGTLNLPIVLLAWEILTLYKISVKLKYLFLLFRWLIGIIR